MKTRPRSADPVSAVRALLALFGPGNYTGEPFAIPGENQLRMTDTMWACGNSAAEDAFGEAMHLYGMTGSTARKALDTALAAGHFSLSCGKADPAYLAARGMLSLMLHRHVNRFLVLVRGAAERESIALSLSAYLEQSARALGSGIRPDVTVYANGESDMTGEGTKLGLLQLRRFVCDPTPQILLMNREYFNRPENLLLRPDVLLDGLRTRGAAATFFLVGEQAVYFPELVQRMQAEGHQVGNHTWSHVRLEGASEETLQEEVGSTEALLAQLLGGSGYWLRPPYGQVTPGAERLVPVPMVKWSVDPRDWESRNADKVTHAVLEAVKPNSIILLHDIYPSSVEAALRIVDTLQAKGYWFVTVEELLRLNGVTPQPGALYRTGTG